VGRNGDRRGKSKKEKKRFHDDLTWVFKGGKKSTDFGGDDRGGKS